jgi:hypothetical protein
MLNLPYICTLRIQNHGELSLYWHLEYPGNEAGEESPESVLLHDLPRNLRVGFSNT